MNYKDLEDIWNDTEEDLTQKITINQSIVNKINMKKITSNLSETRWENLLELGINILFLDFFRGFCLNNLSL